jgi:dehydrogenase/reductase SDR family protein 7B
MFASLYWYKYTVLICLLLVLNLFSSHSCFAFQAKHRRYNYKYRYQHQNRYPAPSAHSSSSEDNIDKYMAMLTCSEPTQKEFAGKSVLLTGASGGLGSALAMELAGCKVATMVISGRNQDTLQAIAEECQKLSQSTTKIHVVPCDLSDRASVQALGNKALELCDTIDVLINNGGVSSRSDFLDTKLEVDERVMQINFFAGAALAKLLVPNMIANKSGKIIWVSSVQGLIGVPSRTSYAASKFAIQGYCEGLRAELATSGVSVHVVSPGYIRTNLSMSAITGDGTAHGKMDETTAAGAEPKEVAVQLLNKVAQGASDFVVAATPSAKVAIWMRLLCPGILQKMLVKRFEKSKKEKVD